MVFTFVFTIQFNETSKNCFLLTFTVTKIVLKCEMNEIQKLENS